MKKVNFDYLNIWKEIPLFCLLIVKNFFIRKSVQKTGKILIVVPSLVGEFAASIPAIWDYIHRHPNMRIDIVVSPPLKKLAQHIIGIRQVFITTSVFARESEQTTGGTDSFSTYEKTIILRISPSAYRMLGNINTGAIQTTLKNFISYVLHLAICLAFRRTPKSWRTINFEMLGGVPRDIHCNELLWFEQAEQKKVAALSALHTSQKKIFIHTGASWVLNRWGNEKWIETVTQLHMLNDFRFIFVGAGKDRADYDAIASQLDFEIYSLIDVLDWYSLLLVFQLGDYFIGIDSGPRNLAHLADLPSITLLGPGPHMFTPHNSRDIILDHSKGRGFYQRFVHSNKNHFIDKIQPSEVVEAFKKLTG